MLEYDLLVVSVAEWLRHLVVAQETVGSNPTTHPMSAITPLLSGGAFDYTMPEVGEQSRDKEKR